LSLALLLSLGLGASATAAPLTPAEEAAIDKAVTGVLSATGVPSAQIAVVRDGRLVYSHAFGKAADNLPAASTAMPYQ
ncbi:serine hydrolase, partial [Pseudomonas sp. FW306-2-11AA]|uniref:hypothetical protein n=1 Tax=Pseudomonas sp. FW306-2-11AA TaxID=2070663 RepID=UPI000CB061DC